LGWFIILEEVVNLQAKRVIGNALQLVVSLDHNTLKCLTSFDFISADKNDRKDGNDESNKNKNDPENIRTATFTEPDFVSESTSTSNVFGDNIPKANYGRRSDFEDANSPEHFYDSIFYELTNPDLFALSARISQVQEQEIQEKDLYGSRNNSNSSSSTVSDTAYETMSIEEAKEMVFEIQYASVFGTLSDLSLQKRQQLANLSYFEPAALNYFLINEGVTRDVDFLRVV
jgi:hypothetical protein